MKGEEQSKERELELLKAVAQAWHSQVGNPKPTEEFHAQKSSFKYRPSRFKLEAISMASKEDAAHWDFAQSLWDAYEIVTLSKKLEANQAFEHPMKPSRESRNSLRKLFSGGTSKRFTDFSLPNSDAEFSPSQD